MEQRVVTAQVKQSSVAGWRVSKLGCALSALSHLPNKHIVTDAQGRMHQHWISTEEQLII